MQPFDLHEYIGEVHSETKNDPRISKERKFMDNFFDNWVGEFLHLYGDDLFDIKMLDDNLFYCYLSGQSTNFEWYRHSIYCGAYTIVFREFRCILEGLFIAFKIENIHHNKTIDEKLEILKDAENKQDFFGKAVFRSSGFENWEYFYTTYQELSSYIHFSYSKTAHVIQKIKNDGFPETIDYTYDKARFLDAYRVWRQMAGLAVNMANKLARLDDVNLNILTDLFD